MTSLYIGTVLVTLVYGDVYLHNPRGSNNRLNEQGRNRNNNNRMFDSQNNNRGGYNVGSKSSAEDNNRDGSAVGDLYYYGGSTLQIEWTNQHSCGSPNSHCEMIIQYLCNNQVRDGSITNTIPEWQNSCANANCNTDTRYGMNENSYHYANCRMRQRNKGLFTADQNLNQQNRQNAVNTRQNPQGTRRAYECPEERDYYPYWHPSPWKDIAVLTNNVTRCPSYQAESQNVKSRWACFIPIDVITTNYKQFTIPNNEQDCEDFTFPANNPNGVKGVWREFPSHGLPPPECRETEFTRDNHLGNGLGGHPVVYNWTIPNINEERCVLRLRYNISTDDYGPWNTTAADNSPNLAPKYGFSSQGAAEARGYEFEGNPNVEVFGDADFTLQLAINTAQYGRTFQDRSHSFSIRPRPAGFDENQIFNLNVRGKRGNIVQVYPAVEYDYVPNGMQMSPEDGVHIQWTGSNTNPGNNDGNGRQKTDRNNLLELRPENYPEGNDVPFGPGLIFGQYGNNYPVHLSNASFLGMSITDLGHLAINSPRLFGDDLSQLNDAAPYFDLGLRKVSDNTKEGTHHFVCTRNNDFSNRDQKGRVTVYPYTILSAAIGRTGGNISLPEGKATVTVEPGVFAELQKLTIAKWPREFGESQLSSLSLSRPAGDDYVSDFLLLTPESRITEGTGTITITMTIDEDAQRPRLYRTTQNNLGAWTAVASQVQGQTLAFRSDRGGVFVVRSHSDSDSDASSSGTIAAVVVVILVIAVIVGGLVFFYRRNPARFRNCINISGKPV